MVENKIKKRMFFTDVVENKGYNFEFPNGENKNVACPSPKDIYIYIDSPVQAKRSSGLKNSPTSANSV